MLYIFLNIIQYVMNNLANYLKDNVYIIENSFTKIKSNDESNL